MDHPATLRAGSSRTVSRPAGNDREGEELVGAHVMVVADSAARQREATGAWLDAEIGRGAKIYYKGWFDPAAARRHWIGGPDGPRRGREALARGQIELCDFATVIERCGGTTAGLHRLQADEVARALDEGWPAVAMAQESPGRPMADETEAAEFAAQEGGYDALAAQWPLRVLCQLTTPAENDAAIWRSSMVHHAELSDARWSARSHEGAWHLSGELDAHVVHRFGGALVGALRAASASPDGPHLHVDVAGVSFLDVACARMLTLAAASAPRGQHIVVHGVSRLARRAIKAIGRPGSLELHGEEGS